VKAPPLWLIFWLALPIPCAFAADVGTFSIVEGPARVLRDTTWYKLAPGARFREGDIVAAAGPGQVQVELVAGGTFNLGAPGSLFAAAVPVAADKLTGPIELWLPEGWLKLAASAPAAGIRVQLESVTVNVAEAVVVIHAKPGATELFVESGTARLADAGTGKSKPVAAITDLKTGDYVAQSAERPLRYETRPPAAFVTSVPRYMIDALPAFAAKYKSSKVQLVADQEITYAEAEPWLAGPYRKTFLKRFQPRLKDREFRAAVEAQIARYPEWDRILHPEKYVRKVPAEAK
jgi:hypothetical protein